MKKRVLFAAFALMLALQGCASAETKSAAGSKPKWINDPYAVCTAEEMCAVGKGITLNRAKADARGGLAKVFEARIKSSFETTLKQDNDDVSSTARDYVSEQSDVILQAVEIKETYEAPSEIFALAVLNKPVAARITKQDIDDLDQKMLALLKEDTPAAAVRLEKLYEERRGLNQRYIVLTGKPAMEEVTYDQVYGNKKARIGKRHIFLTVQGKANPSFDQAVRSVLKKNGYTFANSETADTPRVIISLQAEEQYANIKGFVKYAYHFTMKAPDKKGQMIDVLAATFEETGRNQNQAFSNALEALKAYIKENILNLNF
ncbi:MAG: LPP20 family lipoprotein [Alphaproteobacteria bacterium]|nr:LPP20 family lipoprotein [Alphaproteobacteria bacterium]